MGLARAPSVCGQPGCVGVPVFNGRCRKHARWPDGNAARANGWAMSRLKALLIAERGERCEVPGCEAVAPIEVHHLNGVEDNRPEALELRCRRHNPRGAPTHKR
jgi:hypothetical protein